MAEPPDVRIVGGSPTAGEEQAARAAIERLLREDRAEVAKSAGSSPWVLAARAEATKKGTLAGQGHPEAWRLSGRLQAMQATPTQTGRGDAK